MKKLGWYAGSAALVLLIGGGLLLLAANLYVQSKGVQQQIRRALAASLQMPAQLTKTTLTPWEGLRIDGITVRPETGPSREASLDVLKADSFRVRFALGPLMQRRFVVQEILLDRPQLSWAQDSRGRWHFPPEKTSAEPQAIPPRPESPAVQTAPVEATSPPLAPSTPPPPGVVVKNVPRKPDRFSVDVDRFRVRHGTLELLDGAGSPIGRFEEVNLDGRVRGPKSGSGTLWFDRALLPRVRLALTKFRSRFSYDENAGFALSDGRAELGGGRVHLDYLLHTAESGSPFDARCRLEDVALDGLAPSLGDVLQGRLRGEVTVSGLAADPASRRGKAQFTLANGRLKDFAMLKAIGNSLRIKDLSQMELKTAQLDCHLEGEQLLVDGLQLVSNNLRLSAKGGYDGATDRIDLQARLTIDAAIGRQLPQFIEANFTPCGDEAPGCRYVDFVVGGSLSKPSTDLPQRVLAGPLGTLFQNILAPKPKTKKPKKNPPPTTPEPAQEPASAASPAALEVGPGV